MHTATISAPELPTLVGAQLGGITDVFNTITNAVKTAVGGATSALQAGCALTSGLPSVSPYQTAAKNVCASLPQPGQPSAMTTQQAASGAGAAMLTAQQLLQQQAGGMMTKGLVADGAEKPFYKKGVFWAAVAGGVVVVGGGAVLLSRRGGGRRRR